MTEPESTDSGGRRRLRTGALGALLWALVIGGAAGPAAAGDGPAGQPPEGEDGAGSDDTVALSAEVGIDGAIKPGRPTIVAISVQTSRLVDAELRVTSTTQDHSVSQIIEAEVPGGSTKRFAVLMPTSEWSDGNITVGLFEAGELLARTEPTTQTDSNEELVGVLPLVTPAEAVPATTNLAVDAGRARLRLLDPDLLALGPGALAGFDTIVATAADLEAVDSRSVLAWVQAGGHLLLDEEAGAAAPLPDEWQPGPDLATRAGLGQIRLTEGRAKAGRWDEILYPTPIDSQAAANELGSGDTGLFESSIELDLSEDAGFRLPPLLSLVGLLAVYLVVVGPVSYLVLRIIGQPTRYWVVIPVLAVLATAGVAVVGSDLRQGTDTAHATIVQSGPAPGIVTTDVLVSAGHPGLELGPGWSAGYGTVDLGGSQGTQTIRTDGSSTAIEAEVPPGGFTIASATGTSTERALEVTATALDGETVAGTVSNTTGVSLEEVAVLGASRVDVLGTIAPGEAKEFEIQDPGVVAQMGELQSQAWGRPDDFIDFGRAEDRPDDPVSLSALARFRYRLGPLALPSGSVWVVGWSRSPSAPVELLGGGEADKGRTGFFAVEPVIADDGPVPATAFSGSAVRGPLDTEIPPAPDQPDILDAGLGAPIMAQVVLPARPESGTIAARFPPGAAAEIARGGDWSPIEPNDDGIATFAVDEVAPDGLVHVRFNLDLEAAFVGGRITLPRWFDPATLEDQ